MSSYYLAIVFITIMSMIVSVIHFFENQTLSRRIRQQLIFVAVLISIGVTCEYIGICLNASTLTNTREIHSFVKALEFTLTPIIPASYINIIGYKNIRKVTKILMSSVLIVKAFLEFINIIIPFIFFIDENNIYHHGNLYFIYIIIYCIEIGIFIFEMFKYTKKFQIRNIATLISIVAFLSIGLAIRLVYLSVNSDWIIVTITYLLFIIYYSDLSLKVDPLTGLLNRKSYEIRLRKLNYTTAIIMLDVNNFKQVNDKMGHAGGDDMLKLISDIILKTYIKYGYCYRIGGDEFCIILKPRVLDNIPNKMAYSKFVDSLNNEFDTSLLEQSKEYSILEYGVSKGHSVFYGEQSQSFYYDISSSVQKAIKLADEQLYDNKKTSNQRRAVLLFFD